MARTWEVVPWSVQWSQQYEREASVLQGIFGEEIVELHHVGSTSVPGIGWAKPIIDILIIVRGIDAVQSYNEAMQQAGYRARGENGIPGRRYFTKGDALRTHHVHIYQAGHRRIAAYLDFKAYLLQHPDEAAAYGQLKLDLLSTHPQEQYQTLKQEAVTPMVERALLWAECRKSGATRTEDG